MLVRFQQQLKAVIRSGLCPTNQLTMRELVDDADMSLFANILYNRNHMLPKRRNCPYDLRDRTHDRELIHAERNWTRKRIYYKNVI